MEEIVVIDLNGERAKNSYYGNPNRISFFDMRPIAREFYEQGRLSGWKSGNELHIPLDLNGLGLVEEVWQLKLQREANALVEYAGQQLRFFESRNVSVDYSLAKTVLLEAMEKLPAAPAEAKKLAEQALGQGRTATIAHLSSEIRKLFQEISPIDIREADVERIIGGAAALPLGKGIKNLADLLYDLRARARAARTETKSLVSKTSYDRRSRR